MLKQHGHILDSGAVPDDSTIDASLMNNGIAEQHVDVSLLGSKLGSTGVKIEWSLPDDCVIGQTY